LESASQVPAGSAVTHSRVSTLSCAGVSATIIDTHITEHCAGVSACNLASGHDDSATLQLERYSTRRYWQ